MKKIKTTLLSFMILFICTAATTTSKAKMEEYSIDKTYRKVELDYGTLDEQGQSIDFIFIKEDLKAGRYEVEITDGPNDLYEIKGTNYFIKFNSYYGYAGYGDKGILEISNYGSGSFYKYDD